MNAERLLAHYEQIADAHDAIAHLRRFIVELAVRGKLVPQDANDEPASELLKRIAKEKARLSEVGEIKREKTFDNGSVSDLGMELPAGWSVALLSEVAVCLDYRRLPVNGSERDLRIKGKAQESLFPYYGATQQQGWIDDYLFDGELVLLGEDGVPFHDPLRTKAYLISGKSWVNNHAHVFQSILTSPRFLVHYLNVFDYAGRVVGATRAKLNQAQAVTIPIPIPPLAEQHRIAAKVDELMGLCDELEAARLAREAIRDRLTAASLARLNAPDPETFQTDARFALDALPALTTRPDQIKVLRQTILNLAVRGKLVPQNATDEPGSELLKRIAKEKARLVKAGEIKKEKPLDPITVDNWPFNLPENWSWARLDSLSRLVTKGSSPKWQGVGYVKKDEGILFITSENVGNHELRKLDDLKYVEKRFREIEPRSMLKRGDILMNLVGASIGRTAIYNLDAEANINQAVAVVRLVEVSDGPIAQYLLKYLNSPTAISLMLGSRVITAQPNMSLTDARQLPIPLPPLAEQRRIVAKVDALITLCDRLEASLTAAAATRRRLLDALLAEAFAPVDAQELEAAE